MDLLIMGITESGSRKKCQGAGVSATHSLLFPNHLNCILWALSGTDATTLAEIEVNLQITVYYPIRAVHGTETTLIARLPVNDWPKCSP